MNNPKDHVSISWEEDVRKNFTRMMEKIPIFLRPIAEKKISKRAEAMARENNRTLINEKDMIDAFFAETPFGFHGPMKCDMEELGINYMQYGYPK